MIYPKGEIAWTSYYNKQKELVFLMTSKPSREYYILYECVNGKLERLGRAKSPPELEKRFEVNRRMCE